MTFWTLLLSTAGLVFSLGYPAYGTINALESPGSSDDTQWLVYWLVFSIINILERFLWPVLKWVPLYSVLKVALLAWLVLPQTQGALWLYEAVLAPLIQIGKREASKVPVLEGLMHGESGVKRTADQDQSAYSERAQKLSSAVREVDTALKGKLETINATSNWDHKLRAEKAFDRDLAKLAKIGTPSRFAGSTSFKST